MAESEGEGRARDGARVVVVGAGWAGLGAAHHLTKQVRVKDRDRRMRRDMEALAVSGWKERQLECH